MRRALEALEAAKHGNQHGFSDNKTAVRAFVFEREEDRQRERETEREGEKLSHK